MVKEAKKIRLLQGNEACAEGALLAGLGFFAGYPITPSTEVAEFLASELPKRGGCFIQMEDELASLAACIGASLAGKKAMTATSGPGFSLMQEHIGYASMTETPCVVVNVMRGGPSTGLPTQIAQADVMQARWGTHGDHPIVVLSPSSVQEVLELTISAFNFSEMLRVPVILLMDEVIGHMREKVEMPRPDEIKLIERKKPDVPPHAYQPFDVTADLVPPMADFGSGYRFHVTGLAHDQWGFPTTKPDEVLGLLNRLKDKIDKHREAISLFDEDIQADSTTLLVAYGSPARVALRSLKEARKKGLKVSFFRPITLWPFPARPLVRALNGVQKVKVVELNFGQLSHEVERVVKGRARVELVNRVDGQLITPDEILEALLKEEE